MNIKNSTIMKLNKIYRLAGGMLMASLALLNTSCRQEESPSVDDFPLNYDITRVDLNGDASVGALYVQLNWVNDTTKYNHLVAPYEPNAEPYPQIGPYVRPVLGRYAYNLKSGETVNLVNQHYEWAAEGGIDYFIMPEIQFDANTDDGLNANNVDFYNFMEGMTETSLDKINMRGIKLCASTMPSRFITGTTNSKFVEDDTDENGVSANCEKIYKYYVGIANRFFNDDNYYTVDGKPMVMVWNTQDLHCKDMKQLFDNVRDSVRKATGKEMYLVARQTQWTPTARFTNFFAQKDAFDAFYMGCMYNQTNWVRTSAYLQMIDQNYAYNAEWAMSNCNMEFIPTISPAFNAWIAGTGTNNYQYPFVNYDEDTFRKYCWVAKKNIGQHKMIILDSFNDWNWATAVEPTDPYYGNGYGMKMLNILKSEFKH